MVALYQHLKNSRDGTSMRTSKRSVEQIAGASWLTVFKMGLINIRLKTN